MILAGLGASVIRVDRAAAAGPGQIPRFELLNRGRSSVTVDLKHPAGAGVVRRLSDRADVLIEGFRPGVAERLCIGPDVLLASNPRLIYARMTGWGQDGPLASAAGHDINYIALTGALHAIGGEAGPVPPLNLLGDYGGGAMLLLAGVLAAVHERSNSGRGQVVDVAMVDGVATLMTVIYDLYNSGEWTDRRAANLLDGGAPFYDTYQCADGKWIAVGAIEPQFFAEFERLLGAGDLGPQWDRTNWPAVRARIAGRFRDCKREEWVAIFAGRDACVSPVLAIGEVADDPHLTARGSVARRPDGSIETRPAPRFSRTPPGPMKPAGSSGADTGAALVEWGFEPAELAELERDGTVVQLVT